MDGDVAAGSVRQEIEAIGIPASVLIAIDRPRAFELPATKLGAAGSLRVFPRWSGEAALRVGGGDGDTFITLSHAHYVAYSRPPERARAGAVAPSRAGRAGRVPRRSRGSRAPAGEPGRRTLGDPRPSPGSDALIAAVTRALRAKHGYTLEPRPAPAGVDPVESFLLGEHAGHCELFASAAVLLLRLRGIPARYVTGFRGGEWNTVGNYVAVRDDRAHAWAEAFLPDRGWVRVDATPPGAPLPRAGHLSEVMDALDYFWNRWVVGYDLGRQLELARRAGRHLVPRAAHAPARIFTMAAGACLLAALLLAARRLRRRRARSVHDAHEITRSPIWTAPRLGAVERLYRRTLGRLARAGCPRRRQRDATRVCPARAGVGADLRRRLPPADRTLRGRPVRRPRRRRKGHRRARCQIGNPDGGAQPYGQPAARSPRLTPLCARFLCGHHPCSKMRAAMRRSLGPAFVAAALAAAASLLAAGTASAQFDAGSTTSSLAPEDFFIRMQDIPSHTLSDFDVARYFNKARCDCSTPATIYVALSQSGLAKLSTLSNQGSIEVWIGSSCNDINLRGARCHFFGSTLMTVFLRDQAARLFIPTDVRMMSSQPNLGVDTTFDGGLSGNADFPTRTARSTASSSPRRSGCWSTRTTTACPTSRRRSPSSSISLRRRPRIPRRSRSWAGTRRWSSTGRGSTPASIPTWSATRSSATAAAIFRCSPTEPSTPAS